MESPKEKAKELVKTFGFELAIKVADEIINNHPHKIIEKNYVDSGANKTDDTYFALCPNEIHWQTIKNEIELLNKL